MLKIFIVIVIDVTSGSLIENLKTEPKNIIYISQTNFKYVYKPKCNSLRKNLWIRSMHLEAVGLLKWIFLKQFRFKVLNKTNLIIFIIIIFYFLEKERENYIYLKIYF